MYHTFQWTRASLERNDLTRHYEPLQPHLLMALAVRFECDTFLDIGANIGAYSLLMSKVGSVASIHAFEPSPETFEELTRNLALNGAAVIPHNKAVSDRPAILSFGIVNQLSGANSVIDTSIHQRFDRKIEVPAIRLDDLVSLRGARICIKIDVEGHERQVLAGMGEVLSHNQVVLQIEDYGEEASDLEAILRNHGLSPLFRIGADRYFASFEPMLGDREVIELFEIAAKELVSANLGMLQASYAQEKPIRLTFGKTIALEVGGQLASFGRAVRRKLRRTRPAHG